MESQASVASANSSSSSSAGASGTNNNQMDSQSASAASGGAYGEGRLIQIFSSFSRSSATQTCVDEKGSEKLDVIIFIDDISLCGREGHGLAV